jgi:hypothetical protein
MSRLFHFVIIGLFVGILSPGCGLINGSRVDTPHPAGGTVTYQIEDLDLVLELPEDFSQLAKPANAGAYRFCNETELEMRFMHCFSIEAISSLPEENVTDWNSVSLENDGVFYYRTQETPGGSGGAVDTLEGYLVLESQTFKVGASDQKEFPDKPDATWVLPIITTAKNAGS